MFQIQIYVIYIFIILYTPFSNRYKYHIHLCTVCIHHIHIYTCLCTRKYQLLPGTRIPFFKIPVASTLQTMGLCMAPWYWQVTQHLFKDPPKMIHDRQDRRCFFWTVSENIDLLHLKPVVLQGFSGSKSRIFQSSRVCLFFLCERLGSWCFCPSF